MKLAQTVRDGARVRLHRAAVIQRPTSWTGDDGLALEQPITSYPEIRAAIECGDFAGRNAICALPMNVCQLRSLNVPPGSDQERRTIIADELAEDWAELRNPMEFDFWETEPGKTEKGTDSFNVNVLATSRLWISQVVARLPTERAGLLGDRRFAAGDGANGRAGWRPGAAGSVRWSSIGDIRTRRCASPATNGRCTAGGFMTVRSDAWWTRS